MDNRNFVLSLVAGGCAGTATDLFFFPIDTIKTRLQAKGGFFLNGGYKGIYRGLGSCVIASAPSASLFFISYDSMKVYTKDFQSKPISHMVSASVGEVMACLVRVPAEVIKQRTQAGILGSNSTSLLNFKYLLTNQSGEGIIKGLYRGWGTTLLREIPFTIIQFPLYELFKSSIHLGGTSENPDTLVNGAVCGSIAGGIAAAVTTPLDVIKTRIMLSPHKVSTGTLIRTIIQNEGYKVFLSGIGPRTCWISAGGAVFLGCYELVHSKLSNYI